MSELYIPPIRHKMKPISEVYNMNCLEYMRSLPDKHFDLCIADPPYGININESIGRRAGSPHSGRKKVIWDNEPPSKELFEELFRISKNLVIWGANHFISRLPKQDATCWLLWDKKFSGDLTFSQFEMAWTSFAGMTKKFDKSPTSSIWKFHPTQKPTELYAWILKNYAKQGDKIFDPFLGSGSSRIAAYKMGFDFVGCEIDKEYYQLQEQRFQKECFGVEKLANGKTVIQQTLF